MKQTAVVQSQMLCQLTSTVTHLMLCQLTSTVTHHMLCQLTSTVTHLMLCQLTSPVTHHMLCQLTSTVIHHIMCQLTSTVTHHMMWNNQGHLGKMEEQQKDIYQKLSALEQSWFSEHSTYQDGGWQTSQIRIRTASLSLLQYNWQVSFIKWPISSSFWHNEQAIQLNFRMHTTQQPSVFILTVPPCYSFIR